MLSSYNGEIFNNEQPFIDYIVKDISTGENMIILIDVVDGNIFTEITNLLETKHEIIDEYTGAGYALYSQDGLVFSAPVKTHNGDTILASDCFISAGSTVNVKIKRNNSTQTLPSELSVYIFSIEEEKLLHIEVGIIEQSENFFIASFIIPIPGEFLILVKLPNGTHTSKKISVQRYSYDELISELEIFKGKLNNNNYEAYI